MRKRARHIVLGVQIVVVAIVALFLAVGVNGVLAAFLVSQTPAASASPQAMKPAPVTAANQGAQFESLLFTRNLFNQNADIEPTPAMPVPEPRPGTGDEGALEDLVAEEEPPPSGVPVPTDLQILLVGTQVAEDPAWSLAILKDLEASPGANDALYSRVGQTIKEDATILRIDRKRVYFRRISQGGRIEYIDIETTEAQVRQRLVEARREPAKPATRAPEPAPGSTTPSPNVSQAEPAPQTPPVRVASAGAVDPSAIESLGEDTYGIPRDMAEQVRRDPKMLQDPRFGAPPQIQPVYAGGGVSGFRVLGVQPGSIYDKLGLKNGDIIQNVNGQVVDNPQKALAFFDQLGPSQDVGIQVNRRGRHKTLTYKLK